jgi:type I restriction enzyme, S subunit
LRNSVKFIENIDLMKTSILARAFRSELSTNNPDEESALELLKEVLRKRVEG